jgi:hypothetical protein
MQQLTAAVTTTFSLVINDESFDANTSQAVTEQQHRHKIISLSLNAPEEDDE